MARWQENYQVYKRYVKNIALIYESKKDIRAYIELLLSASVLVIFGIFAIRPTLVTIAELQTEIEAKKELLEKLETKFDALVAADTLVKQNAKTLNLLDTAVPDGPLPVVYSRQLEGLAKRHNVGIFNMGADKVVILGASQKKLKQAPRGKDPQIADRFPSTASSLDFSFSILGRFSDISSFIADVEKLRRPILTDTLSIRTNDDDSILTLTIKGRVPFLTE